MDAVLSAQYQQFVEHLTVHFDTVRAMLGSHQGGALEEHLGISLTGEGEEFQLGVFVAESGRGE